MSRISKVAVIGAGTMGHGIAELAAMAGLHVGLVDVSEEVVRRALSQIEWSLRKLWEKGQLREDVGTVMARITTFVGDIRSAVAGADFVIEAVVEDVNAKRSVFREAEEAAPQHAVFATNTSSIPITEIAEALSDRGRLVGMHFFNPPVLMPLVEVVRGRYTVDRAVDAAIGLARVLGKEVVLVNRDVPGFIVNRVLARLFQEACWTVARGWGDILAVDAALRYRVGLPMGMFELADLTGIDVLVSIGRVMMERGFKMHPCPLFEEKVRAGEVGLKAGRGFYSYPAPGKYARPDVPRDAGSGMDTVRLLAPAVNEAAFLVQEGIAAPRDVDKAVTLGLNFPMGILQLADELGLDNVVGALETLRGATGWEEYEPVALLRDMVAQGRLGRKAGRGFYEYVPAEEKAMETIKLRYEPPIAWIILNRPERLNAINVKMMEELGSALDELEAADYDKVRAIIITGSGRAFCAGADVQAFLGTTPILAYRLSRRLQALFDKVESLSKPVIAAINGPALGGGLELALACDIRIAAETAQVGQPEINLGLIPGAGGTQRLARIVGPARAKELVLTGDMISAREAERMGVVNRVVPPDRLEEEARATALKLASRPPIALMAAKHAINFGADAPLRDALDLEASLFALLFTTEDLVEGVSAFLQKRKPNFRGK